MSFYGPRRYSRYCDVQRFDKVRVISGRKVPIGTEGEVFWISEPQVFGQSRFATITFRVGIKDAAGQVHWTYEKNLKVLERMGKPVNEDGVVIWPTPALFEEK